MHERINTQGFSYFLSELADGKTEIRRDGKSIVVKHDWETMNKAWYYWTNGRNIQDAFPFLNPSEREFLLTGMTKEDWDALFGGPER